MDRVRSMAIFMALAKAGSFSAASRKLGIPVASVSRKISELETRLHARILVRSSRRMTITDAGHAYVEACKHILESYKIEEAQRAGALEFVLKALSRRPPSTNLLNPGRCPLTLKLIILLSLAMPARRARSPV
jgi:DNA-binding transcriptional LysR family regulator